MAMDCSMISRNSDFFPRLTVGRLSLSWAFSGVMKPLRLGKIWHTCCNLPCNFWKLWNGMSNFLRASARASLYLVALSGGKRTVRFMPLNKKPKSSFSHSHRPSPFSSFLMEMGSLPPSCPVTSVGGKMAWIEWNRALVAVVMASVGSPLIARR